MVGVILHDYKFSCGKTLGEHNMGEKLIIEFDGDPEIIVHDHEHGRHHLHEDEWISEKIIRRLQANDVRFHADDNISQYITDDERRKLIDEVEDKFEDVLRALIIDTVTDPNSIGTARRLAKMYEMCIRDSYKNNCVDELQKQSVKRLSQHMLQYI